MKIKSPSLFLSLAVLMTGLTGAHADGTYVYSDGSTKDVFAGVPVPAPAPVPMKDSGWYLRFDIGGSFVGDVDIDVQGPGILARESDKIPTTVFGEGGFGYKVNKNFRVDFTSNFHDSYALTDPTTQTFVATISGLDGGGNSVENDYNVERREEINVRQQSTNLVNFYFDLENGSRFTPYVGAGVGVSYVNTERRTNEEATCFQTETTPPGGGRVPGCNTAISPATINATEVEEKAEWLFAGALMAGASYDFNEYIALDVGYRVLYTPGTIQRSTPSVGGRSTVEWTDFLHHQFRTGLRINVF